MFMSSNVGSVTEPDARLKDADLIVCLELYVVCIIRITIMSYT